MSDNVWKKREQAAHDQINFEAVQREQRLTARARADKKRVEYDRFREARATAAALAAIQKNAEKQIEQRRQAAKASRNTGAPQPGTMRAHFEEVPANHTV